MKKSRVMAALLFFGFCSAGALADPMAAQNIGLGFVFGYPSDGISLKLPMSPNTSLNGILGYDLQHGDMDTRFDYVWYQNGLFTVPKGDLPLYYGAGVHADAGKHYDIGVHGVVGVEYQVSSAPLDFFFEVAPGINLIPNTDLYFSAGLGARFFF